MSTEDNKYSEEYIKTLTDDEKLVINIATKTLESSFDITKSIGFIKWKQKNYK